MSRGFRLSLAARGDLIELWTYLARHASIDVADRVIDDLYGGMAELAPTPMIGHARPDLTDLTVRFYRVRRYLIVYAPDSTPLGIVRILHASRDARALLDDAAPAEGARGQRRWPRKSRRS